MSEDKLIPETMVKLLFDQVKGTADNNTQAIREFSNLIRDLSLVINNQITKKEMVEMLKEHDQGCDKRWEDTYNIIEKDDTVIGTKINGTTDKVAVASKTIEDAAKLLWEIKTSLINIDGGVKEMSLKIKTMITVVIVTFSVTMMIFYFVKSASDTSINTAVKEAVKEIITSRPDNTYPPPHDHDEQGNNILLDGKGKK